MQERMNRHTSKQSQQIRDTASSALSISFVLAIAFGKITTINSGSTTTLFFYLIPMFC
jgi:hypothetical protein